MLAYVMSRVRPRRVFSQWLPTMAGQPIRAGGYSCRLQRCANRGKSEGKEKGSSAPGKSASMPKHTRASAATFRRPVSPPYFFFCFEVTPWRTSLMTSVPRAIMDSSTAAEKALSVLYSCVRW